MRFCVNKTSETSRTFLRIISEYKIQFLYHSTTFSIYYFFWCRPNAPATIAISFTDISDIFFNSLFISLYLLCKNIEHLNTMCLTVSFFLTQNLHLLSARILSIFVFIAFVLMTYYFAFIISDSVSFFIRPSLSHIHFSFLQTFSAWLKNCPCNFFFFNTLLCSLSFFP